MADTKNWCIINTNRFFIHGFQPMALKINMPGWIVFSFKITTIQKKKTRVWNAAFDTPIMSELKVSEEGMPLMQPQ